MKEVHPWFISHPGLAFALLLMFMVIWLGALVVFDHG